MRPLKRPMFKYGGDVKKQGIMHGMNGLRDGGVATTMADATGYAGGGRAALVGNPIFPKGPDGRAMHAQTYTLGGQTYTLPETARELTRRNVNLTGSSIPKTGVGNTSAAQNLSRTQKALQGTKNIYGSAKNLYNKIPFKKYLLPTAGTTAGTMASPLIAAAGTGYTAGKIADYVTRAYDTPAAYAYRKKAVRDDPFAYSETDMNLDGTTRGQKIDDEIGRLDVGKKPGLLPRGGYEQFLKREGIDAEGNPIKEKEVVETPKQTGTDAGLGEGLSKKEIKEYDEKLQKDKLNKIYSLLGVDKAQKNAAAKALADMSRYIDEGGKDTISRKNIGSTLTKGILAFDKRLDKVDQLKEAAGLMIAKGEIEKDIYQSKGSDISKRINYLVNNYGYSKEQALSMVNKEPYDVKTAMAAAVAGKRGASLTNSERANALREGANKEGKELQVVADRQAIKNNDLAGKNATTIAEEQWKSEADDGYYMYGSTIVEVKTVKGKPVAEIIEGSEIIKK